MNLILIYLIILFFPLSANLEKFKEEVKQWPDFRAIHHKQYMNDLYKNAYNEAKTLINYQEKPRIPKIIHQIWLGSPVPKIYSLLIETWKKNHPDWEYILWTDQDVRKMNLINWEIYDMAFNYGMKADILRLEILYKYGGLYVDLDQECIHPHDIFHHITDFYLGLQNTKETFLQSVANGLIGASKNNKIIKQAILSISRNINLIKYSSLNKMERTMLYTGPFQLANTIDRHCNDKQYDKTNNIFLLLPTPFFYPLKTEQLNITKLRQKRIFAKKLIDLYCYGIQYHTCMWQKKGGCLN